MSTYQVAKEAPVLRFFYQGSNSHPIRRTVVKVEEDTNTLTGYEMRRGNEICNTLPEAPIRTYRKDRIAKIRQLDARRPLRRSAIRRKKSQSASTLTRHSLEDLLIKGA